MRIISLLPAATEIVRFLGVENQLVGNENLIKTIIDETQASKHIDLAVYQATKNGQGLYQINNKRFISLKPDLVITQQLCEVCAITPTDIQAAIKDCKPIPDIISLHPHSIKEILGDILTVGRAIGEENRAKILVKNLEKRMVNIRSKTKNLQNKPKVYCMEWLDPPYSGGHWVPEQVEIAGGRDELANKGVDSTKIMWQNIVDYDPGIIILMPCGFSIERAKKELNVLTNRSEWLKLKAVRENRVYLVNGPAYFNSSGPRVVEGIDLLASIFHPELFPNRFNNKDFQKLN